YTLSLDDVVILGMQKNKIENGMFIVTLLDPGNNEGGLTKTTMKSKVYYKSLNGPNTDKLFYTYYQAPYELSQTEIYLFENLYRRKSDPRLNITFKQYAKLGVDNEYQPFININQNVDSVEIIENYVS